MVNRLDTIAVTALCGLLIIIVFVRRWVSAPRNKESEEPTSTRSRARSRTTTVDFTEAVDKARQVLPSVKNFLKEILIHRFLSNWYRQELEQMKDGNGSIQAWSAVAHSSSPLPNDSRHIESKNEDFSFYPTMNIAFPDLSAEYYLTFVPATEAPVFYAQFPDWVIYGALTVYDTYGLPISSVNAEELRSFRQICEGGVNNRRNVHRTQHDKLAYISADQPIVVNLLKGCIFSGSCVVVCRFYRPPDIDIAPRTDLPAVYFIGREDVESFNHRTTYMRPLDVASRRDQFEAGKRIESFFSKLIVGKLREPTPDLYGCQFFHPAAVVGCFPNSDAVYVLVWRPRDMTGMRIELQVPEYMSYRPYYGIMSIDHNSSATISSLTFEELGGWGAKCVVFVARTLQDATRGGYNENNRLHRTLLWGEKAKGPLGVVLRYIHYVPEYDDSNADITSPAHLEREMLMNLGARDDIPTRAQIPGMGTVIFF